MKAASRNITISSVWILTFVVLKSSILFCESNDYNHKLSSLSQIPWNILLNPNYTNHKLALKTNRTSFSTENHAEYPPTTSSSDQQNFFNSVKELTNSRVYYVQPPPSNPHQIPLKHSSQFIHHDGIKVESFSFAAPHSSPANNTFPKASSSQVSKSVITELPPRKFRPSTKDLPNTMHPKKKLMSQLILKTSNKNSSRKQRESRNIIKEIDLNEEVDDYLDSYYHDYDYIESEKDSYKTSNQLSLPNKNQKLRDPLGHLHTLPDSDRILTKVKDLSLGGSYNRPIYSVGTSADNKYYGDTEPYEGNSYTNQDDDDLSKIPNKTEVQISNTRNTSHSSSLALLAALHQLAQKPHLPLLLDKYTTSDVPYGLSGYNYAPAYKDGKYQEVTEYSDRRKFSKYGPFAFALGLLPLGLLIASLVPTVVTIPITTAVASGRRRKRNVKFINPVLETISEFGLQALEDPSCLKRIFCQVVRDEHLKHSSVIQKLYLKTAYTLDETVPEYVGLKTLHLAIRKNECYHFRCLK